MPHPPKKAATLDTNGSAATAAYSLLFCELRIYQNIDGKRFLGTKCRDALMFFTLRALCVLQGSVSLLRKASKAGRPFYPLALCMVHASSAASCVVYLDLP